MNLKQFFKIDETVELAKELAAIPPARKRMRTVMDARKRNLKPGARVGPSRVQILQAELTKANGPQVEGFLNWAIDKLRQIPKLAIVKELSRERHMDTTPVLRITENSRALAQYQELILQAIETIRAMQNRESFTTVETAITDWKTKIESFDTTATNESAMRLDDFRAATKSELGQMDTGYLLENGLHVLKTGRVQ